ncbi:hypothetical protein DJ489_23670 [Enterobacter hormaechei]|nr:hypothetical protein DJ489_23670 [Enterobacter hormaechei]
MARLRIQPMLDFRWVVKNRKIQPETAFFPTKNQGLEWMNSNPRMQIAIKNRGERIQQAVLFHNNHLIFL